ncbi:MAG: phosphocholine cytidylyltransferase family protein [Henriciella sp.]|nr:phosphocholine cytidylyltransferase family protein [Henriciella sp.]
MRAIILAAGRGSRLLPLTENLPKCLLPVGASTVLSHQLDTLERAGVEEAIVITGFMAGSVEAEVADRTGPMRVQTLFNPFFQVADNLASCWMARDFMDDDFLLINGDTLIEQSLAERVVQSPANDIQVTIDKKASYDSDDMKVSLNGAALTAIGKTLKAEETHGESIGFLRFMQDGPRLFQDKLHQMMRTGDGVQAWFLSAIDALAKTDTAVMTLSIEGMTWAELDTMDDYAAIKTIFG